MPIMSEEEQFRILSPSGLPSLSWAAIRLNRRAVGWRELRLRNRRSFARLDLAALMNHLGIGPG